MRRETVDLSNVRTIVLDEADQMLDMGFVEDIELVLEALPADRLMALFSATMPDPIVALGRRHMRDPEIIQLSRPRGLTLPAVDQVYYIVPYPRKLDALCRVLDARQPERTMVFCARSEWWMRWWRACRRAGTWPMGCMAITLRRLARGAAYLPLWPHRGPRSHGRGSPRSGCSGSKPRRELRHSPRS